MSIRREVLVERRESKCRGHNGFGGKGNEATRSGKRDNENEVDCILRVYLAEWMAVEYV